MAAPALGRAQDLKDRFNIKLSLTGMYLTEQQGAPPAAFGREAQVASPFELGYGEVRAVIDGRRLPGSFDLHLDGRVRIAGEFSTEAAQTGADAILSRGYLGGREYDLRQAWVRRRGDKWDVAFGRMLVAEADALKLDGARLWWRMAKHWDASLYAGAYPNPYSRSLLTDYQGGFAFVGGGDAKYTYDKIWGSFSVSGSYLGGNNAGGPLVLDPNTGAANPPVIRTETPRTWLTWTDYVRLFSWLDVFTDLVVDMTGQAGAQLTRLDALAILRGGKHFTLRLGYDHLSSLAIEMWLTRLLADRAQHVANTIENNLLVERTGRDEAHGDFDLSFGKFSVYADGRFRRRAMVSLTDDPQFVQAGAQIAPGTAWDVTVGLRDRGSLLGLRPGLWGMYLSDYRSRSAIVGVDLGRSFFDERLDIQLAFLYALVNDSLANNPAYTPCTIATVGSVTALQHACYGRLAGGDYEVAFTVSGQPFNHWFGFFDYRLVADTAGGEIATGLPQPTILTHLLLLRIEARY